jgi:hypothetical protein
MAPVRIQGLQEGDRQSQVELRGDRRVCQQTQFSLPLRSCFCRIDHLVDSVMLMERRAWLEEAAPFSSSGLVNTGGELGVRLLFIRVRAAKPVTPEAFALDEPPP